MAFEKWTNMARKVIEIYPLLGILGRSWRGPLPCRP
ncbi:MAG: hypothetical protein Ct9H300mP1_14290 [Planctomycetaceae bacterium]|nr:MAG: hypothetical protein Ct9H300mP1_14290 [Planctomycetaceae bacterium]